MQPYKASIYTLAPRGPRESAGSHVLEYDFMITYIAYLDEFGHDGPFISRHHKVHNGSPVFGLAGFVLPVHNIRKFSTDFFKMKKALFAEEIKKSQRPPAKWEKKGADHFRVSKIEDPTIRETFIKPINTIIHKLDGHIFYVGSAKNHLKREITSSTLYKYTLREAIKRLDNFCMKKNANLLLCADYHSNRKMMIETCGIEMFGISNRTSLLEPMFHADSHLYQTVQFADWIAAIIGKYETYNARPDEYTDYQKFHHYFDKRLQQASINSSIRPV